ncbi:pyrrolo-quinoline quinone [Sphingomonas ginkgonis]|uniref:Pyrrolo-quinoline quinone n=1 Tax=Sphingomonas ginkgonis TaxID=2315330 RepID=A0A429V8S3_9SPHN|nr:PQQ-binding-like beta-propeller repeat protein [Sphingomonas ginkgonis]RST30328.1 pyrrolo-quinoline quinone [Sphingomonas ginkgonis]
MNRRIILLLAATILASGCSVINKKRPTTPVLGNRVSVLTNEADISIDPATAAAPFSIPEPVANADWAQPGGDSDKAMNHVALGSRLATAWTAQIGAGATLRARLAAAPVVAGGKVFTIDANSTVRAFDARTGRQLWATQFGSERRNEASLFGGGLAVDNGRVFATNGLGYVAALSTENGGRVWQVHPGGPLRGSPSVSGGTLYVMSQDNQLYSLKEQDGSTNWSAAAALEIAGVFGAGSPAIAQGTVVAGFSSGELNAYRYENGRLVWQDALQRTSINNSVSSLSDIDADPIIDNGQVFAVGQGGRMVSLDLVSGQRIWELNIAGISTPWVAGDWLFVTTDDAKLVAIARQTGKVRWINQLPRWLKPKAKTGPIHYDGPILAGGRLIVTGTNGAVINVDPATGAFQNQSSVGASISLPPVVAGQTLYVLDDRGRLTAFR